MPFPEGCGTLGPIRLSKKLKDAFKELYKGKVEERIVQHIHDDVKRNFPDWKDED
jgi:hypothetical protein